MTAVVGPVSIQHPDFRHRGIALLLFRKIILNMQKVLERHGKTKGFIQLLQLFLRHVHKVFPFREILQYDHIRRLLIGKRQRLRLYHAGFSRIHGIDTVCLDPRKLIIRHVSIDQISHCRFDDRFFVFLQKLHALHSGISPLVKLPRQELYGKYPSVFRNFNLLPI